MRRIAKTISNVKEMLGDYDVGLILQGNTVSLYFPDMEIYKNHSHPGRYKPANKPDEGSQFRENTRCVIRSLVKNPQFWRMTTVMDQLHGFINFFDGKKLHNIVSLKKKKNESPVITFDSAESAKKFYAFMI